MHLSHLGISVQIMRQVMQKPCLVQGNKASAFARKRFVLQFLSVRVVLKQWLFFHMGGGWKEERGGSCVK
jgi:hypothetical protein